ncbi:hypothetical protein [uncultured Gilvimarinus sp.]|uniref:hypothetical protein n=1 Tax=uncultured Gilvimarinus sp. TaxID=1689143 RepID=UPI0030EB2201
MGVSDVHSPELELLDMELVLDASLETELLESELLALAVLDELTGGEELVPPLLPQAVNTLMLSARVAGKNQADLTYIG